MSPTSNPYLEAVQRGAPPEVLTVEDLALLLRMSPSRVRDHLRTRVLPGRKLGRRWLAVRSEILAALAARPSLFVVDRGAGP